MVANAPHFSPLSTDWHLASRFIGLLEGTEQLLGGSYNLRVTQQRPAGLCEAEGSTRFPHGFENGFGSTTATRFRLIYIK
jgi:hypothetical protein